MYAFSVFLTVIALVARVGIEYLSGKYEFLAEGVSWCNYVLYGCLVFVALMAILKIIISIVKKRKMKISGSIIATIAVGIVYAVFVWLGNKYEVVTPWVEWVGYALIGVAALMMIFIIGRVIYEIKKV